MSIEQENVVREFLGPHWSRLPYDWVQELGPEGLEPMLPIPDAVWAAYDATRGDPIDRARDEHLYGRTPSREERHRAMLDRRAELGLPLIPSFSDHYDKISPAERLRFEALEMELRAMVAR